MDDRHRTILRKGRMLFIQNLSDIQIICDRLFSYGVLTEGMFSEIMSEAGRESQVRKILDIIPRRGLKAFDFFHQTLVESGQQDLADILKPEMSLRPQAKISEPAEETVYSQSSLQHPVCSPVAENLLSSSENYHSIHSTEASHNCPPFSPATVEPLKVKLQKCNREEIAHNSESYYSMQSKPRGKVIIVNIFKFDDYNLPKRDEQCHNISATSMTLLFNALKFEVDVKANIDKKGLSDIIDASRRSSENYDCFVMVILTHGTGDLICMSDGEPLQVNNIINQFDAVNCPNLRGKPKLFFIHACTSDTKQPECVPIDSLFPTVHEEDHKLTKADIFLARATTYDPMVHVTESKGFRFIQAFVHMMKYHSHTHHLLDIITKVNGLAKEDNQLVDTTHTLRKDLYFFPE